jgi:hypothetical protein
VIDVAVADEDAADVSEREAESGETVLQRLATLARADARVEEGDAAALLFDDVDVRGSSRLDERDRHRNAEDP